MICRTECRGVHPEFICRNGQYTWLPRTWGCHAFQRKPPKDLGQKECHVLNCRQLHRRGFHHCELASFRAWALQAHPNQWFTVWYSDADLNGRTPVGIIEHRQMIHCLCNQPFMTPEKHRQHDWREIVPAPLTYLEGFSPLEPNYHEPERVQRRRREHRSVTPRLDRHPTSRPTSFGPQQFLQQPHSQAASSQQHTPRFQRTGTTEIHRIHSSIEGTSSTSTIPADTTTHGTCLSPEPDSTADPTSVAPTDQSSSPILQYACSWILGTNQKTMTHRCLQLTYPSQPDPTWLQQPSQTPH